MLVLSRKKGEKLMIGDDVSITVLQIKGNQIRLGIHAPKELPVHREEIYRVIHTDKESKQGPLPYSIAYKSMH